ncbi:uncharacterized protein LOC124922691 isoform X2 [Impatiens glandulifera]|uniref:uncharacterized protein LOC124922691 isoform X2 n=1 Tax=Impatiens glandulifera TaxID=253017 RepID=UPI001FB18098|nr:uncharacterized protein LOC124922691 isoform X2 [Impatiens glandulifera]
MPKPPLADFLQPPISSSRRSSLAIVLLSRRSTRRHRSPPTANLRRCSPSVANSSWFFLHAETMSQQEYQACKKATGIEGAIELRRRGWEVRW